MKKLIVVMFLTFLMGSLSAVSWMDLLKPHHLSSKESDLVRKQYISVCEGTAPTIAQEVIKNIVIEENGDEIIDIRAANHARIYMMPSPPAGTTFTSCACNSGFESASKIRKEVYKRLEKMLEFLDLFAPLFGYFPGEIDIQVFEGLRSLTTQKRLFENKKTELRALHPEWNEQQLEQEAGKWVSPYKDNVPVHSTGGAIDIRLWNRRTNEYVDAGKFGVIWGENKGAPTFSEEITDVQKMNRLYLLMAAVYAGLINYPYEYWHFSCNDRYAAYWNEEEPSKRVAYYGSVE